MRRRPASTELLAWSLVGLGLGVAAGFALGGWLGPSAPRTRRPDADDGAETVSPLKPSAASRAVRTALAADETLGPLALEPIGVSPGVVELHGWVPSRSLRARAARLAASTPGIESLVNCLLVRGEDDADEPALDATDQPA